MRILDRIRRYFAYNDIHRQLFPAPSMQIRLRLYSEGDRDQLLKIYDDNAPGRFPENGRADFEVCLQKNDGSLFVVENLEHGVIACGGVSLSGDQVHTLYYGMVSPPFQGCRIGSTSALARLAFATRGHGLNFSIINAVEKSLSYYQRFGYRHCGNWDENGKEHPIGVLCYHALAMEPIAEILKKRGHMIAADTTVVYDKIRRITVREKYRGEYQLITTALTDDGQSEEGKLSS